MIGELLKVNGSLSSIDLSGNRLRSEGAKVLVDGGAFRGSLSSIKLTSNKLGPEGAKALAPALRDSHSLSRSLKLALYMYLWSGPDSTLCGEENFRVFH